MSETKKLFESFQRNLNESKDNTKYIVCSYYDNKLHGLEDELFIDDWTEATLFAHDKLMNGFMVEIENTTTGKYKRINPDDYNEEFDGEFTIRPEELEESDSNENNKKYTVTYTKIDNYDKAHYESKTFNNKEDAEKFSKSLKDNKKYFYRDIKIKEIEK